MAKVPGLMKVLLTGGSGFIGKRCCEQLLLDGFEVLSISRSPTSILGVVAIVGDINNPDLTIEEAIGSFRPDVVLNLGWEGVANSEHGDPSQQNNLNGIPTIMSWAFQSGAKRWIGLGSQAEYGLINGVISETTQCNPVTEYGKAKLSACHLSERLAKELGLEWTWVRLFSCYGPGDDGKWLIPYTIRQLLAGQPVELTPGEQIWDYLYIQDVVDALCLMTRKNVAGLYNLGSGFPVKIKDVALKLAQIIGRVELLEIGQKPYNHDQIMWMQADPTKIARDLGWRPKIKLDRGLQYTVEYHEAS